MIEGASTGVRNFFLFLGSPICILAVIFGLGLWVYWVDTMRKRMGGRVREMERELKSEREDKRYLLRFYNIKL